MKKTALVGFLLVSVGAIGGAGSALARAQKAPTPEEHTAWMDDAGEAQEDAADAVQAKDAAKLAVAAEKIAGLMSKTEAYWAGKHAADIVTLAQESRTLAAQLATVAKAGKLDEAAASLAKMNANCTVCHELHPEKR
jgi:hypothetical protein